MNASNHPWQDSAYRFLGRALEKHIGAESERPAQITAILHAYEGNALRATVLMVIASPVVFLLLPLLAIPSFIYSTVYMLRRRAQLEELGFGNGNMIAGMVLMFVFMPFLPLFFLQHQLGPFMKYRLWTVVRTPDAVWLFQLATPLLPPLLRRTRYCLRISDCSVLSQSETHATIEFDTADGLVVLKTQRAQPSLKGNLAALYSGIELRSNPTPMP